MHDVDLKYMYSLYGSKGGSGKVSQFITVMDTENIIVDLEVP